MAERYTCIRRRLLGRINPSDLGILVALIMVIHDKLLDGRATLAEVERDGVVLDRHDLFLIGGMTDKPSRTRDRCVRVIDRNGPHLGHTRDKSGPTCGAINGTVSVTVVWPNFQDFCKVREAKLHKISALTHGKQAPIRSRSNQIIEQAHSRASQEEAGKKEEARRRSEDFAAVVEELSLLGLEVDESALVSDFAEAYQQAKGRGKAWFVEQARAGRWKPEGNGDATSCFSVT